MDLLAFDRNYCKVSKSAKFQIDTTITCKLNRFVLSFLLLSIKEIDPTHDGKVIAKSIKYPSLPTIVLLYRFHENKPSVEYRQ